MTGTDADWLATLARQLGAETDVDSVWRRVVDATIARVGGAEHASITSLSNKSLSTPVASSEVVHSVDKHQYTIGQGPCLTAATQHEPVVRVDDLTTDDRWPEFAQAATDLGVRSMLSFELATAASAIGALNVYAFAPAVFTDESVHTGRLLAAHAAVAAAAAAKSSNLRIALDSRDVIGQAKGILMERYKLSPQQAFDLLITASQRANRKLRDVAGELAETGELPGGTTPP